MVRTDTVQLVSTVPLVSREYMVLYTTAFLPVTTVSNPFPLLQERVSKVNNEELALTDLPSPTSNTLVSSRLLPPLF